MTFQVLTSMHDCAPLGDMIAADTSRNGSICPDLQLTDKVMEIDYFRGHLCWVCLEDPRHILLVVHTYIVQFFFIFFSAPILIVGGNVERLLPRGASSTMQVLLRRIDPREWFKPVLKAQQA